MSHAAFAQVTPTVLCHKLPLHREHQHYCVTSCLCTWYTYIIVSQAVCTGNTYIIVSQAAFPQATPTLLCHKLPLHMEHLHYSATSCFCRENTYIIVSQAAFTKGPPTLLSQAAFPQGTPTLLCHKLSLPREHLYYCVTSCLCTGTTYIIVSQAAFA